jgi:hypothetical protein
MILAIEAYNATVVTDDRLEGVRAFNEKRKPSSREGRRAVAIRGLGSRRRGEQRRTMAVMNLPSPTSSAPARWRDRHLQAYPGEYWRALDRKREYPEAFVKELTRAGYLGALIPEQYGGAGLGISRRA